MRKSSASTRTPFLVGLLFVLSVVCSIAPASAGGIAPDLDQQIQSDPGRGDKVRVIVQFAMPDADGGGLARAFGGKLHCLHPLINGATLSVPLSAVRALSKHPWVAWISPDRALGAKWDCADQTIAADQVWSSYGLRGSGVTVAVIDSGIAGSMPDFCSYGTSQSRIIGWKDFINGASQPYDDYGHGTHVAGIVGGSGNDSGQLFQGVAPQANLVGVKVLDQTGCGLASTVVNGIN